MLQRIIYVSEATATRAADIDAIVEASRANNDRAGISGALCYLDGAFMQYLEGESKGLQPLLGRILADPRHTNVRLLVHDQIDNPIFSGWAMAHLAWTDESRSTFRTFCPGRAPDLRATGPEWASALFRTLSLQYSWTHYPWTATADRPVGPARVERERRKAVSWRVGRAPTGVSGGARGGPTPVSR